MPIDWSHGRFGETPRALVAKQALARACSQSDAGVPVDAGTDAQVPDAGGNAGPNLDWNFTTSGAVNATPALWIASWPNPSPTDAVYFGTRSGSFFKLSNLYQPAPTEMWSTATGGLDGSAVTLSLDGSKVYALDRLGDLYCFDSASGGVCSGWNASSFHTGSMVSRSSPWVDYGSGAIFYGDLGGNLDKVDGATGTLIWRVGLGSAIRSSPIVLGGFVYVGNDAGSFFRVRDPGATTPAGADIAQVSLCGGACDPMVWAVVGSPTADVGMGNLWTAANGSVFEFPLGAGTWASTAQKSIGTPAGVLTFSSPTVDVAGGNLFIGYYNALFRVPYPLGSRTMGVPLYGSRASAAYPLSSPLVFGGKAYIGNGAGEVEQYGCLVPTRAPDLLGVTQQYGNTVDTAIVVDYANGNVLFGYGSDDGTAGGLVQITQAGGWGCGTHQSCASAGCGGGACTPVMACVPDGIPPSVVWFSSGGGSGSAAAYELAQSVGGSIVFGSSAVSGSTVTFGAFSNGVY